MPVDSLTLPAAADTFADSRANAFGMDPASVVDFWFDFSQQLQPGEGLVTPFIVAPLPDAAALGLTIVEAPNPPRLVKNGTGVAFWAAIAAAQQGNAAFSGSGTRLGVRATCTTSGGRLLPVTGLIQVLAR